MSIYLTVGIALVVGFFLGVIVEHYFAEKQMDGIYDAGYEHGHKKGFLEGLSKKMGVPEVEE